MRFEKSVELDGKNLEAINDLFSYYLEAPGFLGGGLDKAAIWPSGSKPSIQSSITTRWLRLRTSGKIIRERNHISAGPSNWPRVRSDGLSISRNISRRTGRKRRVRRCSFRPEKIAPNEPRVMFERAQYLIRTKKDLD